jgi:hypothetical protein
MHFQKKPIHPIVEPSTKLIRKCSLVKLKKLKKFKDSIKNQVFMEKCTFQVNRRFFGLVFIDQKRFCSCEKIESHK